MDEQLRKCAELWREADDRWILSTWYGAAAEYDRNVLHERNEIRDRGRDTPTDEMTVWSFKTRDEAWVKKRELMFKHLLAGLGLLGKDAADFPEVPPAPVFPRIEKKHDGDGYILGWHVKIGPNIADVGPFDRRELAERWMKGYKYALAKAKQPEPVYPRVRFMTASHHWTVQLSASKFTGYFTTETEAHTWLLGYSYVVGFKK